MAADNVMSIQQIEEQVSGGYADMAALYKGNVEALMVSSQALVGGCQTATAAVLAFIQSRAKESLTIGKRLAECGSPGQAAEIQLEFAKETVQAYADQLTRMGEMSRQVLKESFVPFEQRVATVAKRTADSVAA